MQRERPPVKEKYRSAHPGTDELRCCCGSLLARLAEDGIELKCRRCKRVIVLDLGATGAVHRRAPPSAKTE